MCVYGVMTAIFFLFENCYKADILEQLLVINLSYIQSVFSLDSGQMPVSH